jgi:beta-glucosidase
MWYPGQAGGPATANVLLGTTNPGGKLPMTFPASGTALPTYDPNCADTSSTGNCPIYPGVARPGWVSGLHGYREITALDMASGNGLFEGYRWYDKHAVTPMFAFGHGLSYTTFAYSHLLLEPRSDGTVEVGFDVKNTGDVRGDEVPQVYVGAGPAIAGVQQATKALRGFTRIALNPGETKRVSMTLTGRSFAYWSTAQSAWVANPGQRMIWVGSASDDLRLVGVGAVTAGTGIGGSVPPTLALTLGPSPTFGAFAPGVAKDYFATLAATVTSTAADATLSVADTSPVFTGHLVHRTGAVALAQPLLARIGTGAFAGVGSASAPQPLATYATPVSSDQATIEFKQAIAATDPLRTGDYGKTLTFTLSTTTP